MDRSSFNSTDKQLRLYLRMFPILGRKQYDEYENKKGKNRREEEVGYHSSYIFQDVDWSSPLYVTQGRIQDFF